MVSDRTRSVEWYTKALGLDLVESSGHWVSVGTRGTNGVLHLCQYSDLPDLELEPGETGIDLCLAGDFRAQCARMRKRGVRFVRAPTKRPWGWYAKVEDPDGNLIRLTPEPEPGS
jgi:catechol 2,3-dioxygenase-like lactoylglutathione lyase family enzyme